MTNFRKQKGPHLTQTTSPAAHPQMNLLRLTRGTFSFRARFKNKKHSEESVFTPLGPARKSLL